jgi:hypothetical protein
MKQTKKIKKIKAEMKKIWKELDAKREKKIVFPKKLTKKQMKLWAEMMKSQRMMKCGSDLCDCAACQTRQTIRPVLSEPCENSVVVGRVKLLPSRKREGDECVDDNV